MELQLDKSSVIVTASSKGIGKAISTEFAREGSRVIISSRNKTELQKAVIEIKEQTNNDNVNYVVCDITNVKDIKLLVKKTVKLYGTVDILVNNSGGPPGGTFEDFNDQEWQSAFESNLLSYIRTIKEVLPYMKSKNKGHILNIASSSIYQALDNLTLSNVFRPGILGLAKTLSQELAKYNIIINTIGPSKIKTERFIEMAKLNAKKNGVSFEEQLKKIEKDIPLGRSGNPEELAKIAVFLCSGINTYITGQSLLVDGGFVKAL